MANNIEPTRRRSWRQQDSVRTVGWRVCKRLQPGHVHRGAGRAHRPLQPRRREAGRGDRRSGAQAQPRLQPDARVCPRQRAVAVHAGVRHPAGVRHGAAGDDRGRRWHRRWALRRGRRRRRGHRLRRADRLRRRSAPGAARAAPVEVQRRPAQAGRQAARGAGRGDSRQQRAAHRAVDG